VEKNAFIRSLVSTAVALVVVGLIVLFMPKMPLAPKGVVLPVGPVSSVKVKPEDVAFYDSLSVPLNFKAVGWLNIRYHVLNQTSEAIEKVNAYAKELAAKAGGNGIILDIAIHAGRSDLAVQVLEGQVIYTR